MSLAAAFRRAAARWLCFVALSCGGAPAALEAPATQINPAAALRTQPSPDLSAVHDPRALVVSGRLARPSASLAIVRGWSKLPMPQSEEVTELVMGEAAGPLVDLDQPIDFAISVVGSGSHMRDRTAVSVALKDLDHARATLSDRFKLVAGDNGALLIQGLGRPTRRDDDDGEDAAGDDDHRTCELAPAYGAAAMRLVCGWSAKALSELAPWLTRTATRLGATSDLHIDLRMLPLRSSISGQKRLIGSLLASVLGARLEPASARELVSSVGGDFVDFAIDLETATVDVQLAEAGATATATVRLSGATSALARLATAHPDRTATAPAAFWQLPGDADCAFFERGIDDTQLARGRELLLPLVGDWLAEYGLKDADRKPILDALAKMTSSAPIVYGSGLDDDAASKALATERSLRESSDAAGLMEAERVATEALLGWRVIELDEPAARLAEAVKELASAWGKPAVAAAYRAKTKGASPPALHAAPMPKGATLPAGAQHYVLELRPFDSSGSGVASVVSGKPKVAAVATKPVVIHLILVADGARSWVGAGGSDALVASKLAAAIAPAGDKLVDRVELAAMKTASVGAGGFVTARGLSRAAGTFAAMLGGSMGAGAEGFDEVAQLRHRGAVPITFSLTARADPAPAVTASVEVSRTAVEDIVKVILRHGF
jgi:hypothetical protein